MACTLTRMLVKGWLRKEKGEGGFAHEMYQPEQGSRL